MADKNRKQIALDKGTFAKGLLLGAAAGAFYIVSRRLGKGESPSLVDWVQVRRMAVQMSQAPPMPAGAKKDLTTRYVDMARQSEDLISQYTGWHKPGAHEGVRVFDRVEWIDANIANFRDVFNSVEQLNSRLSGPNTPVTLVLGVANRMLVSGQMGTMMGYLSKRVLGQYDMALLGKGSPDGGKLYFVEPNIADLEHKLHLDGEALRLWISLHEMTHAFQFECNPWLREYMNGLARRYFETVSFDLANMRAHGGGLGTMVTRIVGNLLRGMHLTELVMTSEQQRLFRQLQALMCLVEGYSNHVMQRVGESIIPGYHRLKARFDERAKQRTVMDNVVARLIGMDVKMEQYALGERFVDYVVNKRGIKFMNLVWTSPVLLPSMEEVRYPEAWIARAGRWVEE